MSGVDGTGRRYRLRGDVGGVERRFTLEPGRARIGSIGGNDIVLPVRGVSRHHALLSWGDDGLLLEDLGSRNGVLVNGERARRARLGAGDEIRLGPVALRLEQIDTSDAELAIAVDDASRPVAGLPSGETTAVSDQAGGRGSGGWVRLVERFLTRLCVRPEADLAGALGLLVGDLPALGACLVEWAGGPEPIVLAVKGRIEDLSAGDVKGLLEDAMRAGQAEVSRTDSGEGRPTLCCAVLSSRGLEPLGLVVWGDVPDHEESEALLRTLLRLVDRFRPRPVHVLQEKAKMPAASLAFPDGYVPGESPAMSSLYGQMRPLLEGDLPVLIVGETGVGKEYVARILHASSSRRKGPFVAINCAAIPAELLEAEMFGIGKGIATGVVEREGKFQLAARGTLFLDEIGDMSQDLQAKLLRALQEKEIQPVGGAPVAVDIRIVAATNTDLRQRIEGGRFRRDLFYRIAGYELRVPPLRERREDVPALVEGFVRASTHEAGRSLRGITVKALRALTDYDWPGNIRELEHEVRRLVYLCPEGEAIDSTMLSEHFLAPRPAGATMPEELPAAESLDLEAHLKTVEERLIREALKRAGSNRTQAAKLLGISRNGLAIKMERLGITA